MAAKPGLKSQSCADAGPMSSGCARPHVLHARPATHPLHTHHISEGVFKATARALRMAVEADPRMTGVPSTKGTLTT